MLVIRLSIADALKLQSVLEGGYHLSNVAERLPTQFDEEWQQDKIATSIYTLDGTIVIFMNGPTDVPFETLVCFEDSVEQQIRHAMAVACVTAEVFIRCA